MVTRYDQIGLENTHFLTRGLNWKHLTDRDRKQHVSASVIFNGIHINIHNPWILSTAGFNGTSIKINSKGTGIASKPLTY